MSKSFETTKGETTSLLSPDTESLSERMSRIWQPAKVCVIGTAMILTSAGVISFNKHLMSGGFPFPTQLVMMHTAFCSTMAGILFLIAPSFFPSLTDSVKKIDVNRNLVFKSLLPIAVLFAGHLVLSNTAYKYCTVAFLQMLKETNVVWVYLLSVLASLEKLSIQHMAVLSIVMMATFLTIKGELHFSLTGFFIQGTCLLFECCKIVLQTILLSNTGRKLDPLTFVLLVSPLCFTVLSSTLVGVNAIGVLQLPMSTWADIGGIWSTLLMNCCVAFLLNLLMAAFLQASSGMSFVLANILKDVMIVLAGVRFMGEEVSGLQSFGFTLQIMMICLWALMKTFPERFSKGIINGLVSTVSYPKPNLKTNTECKV